jgi:hypothetical protein
VPRAEGLRRRALVSRIGADGEVIDLRAIASALSDRRDVRDWRIVTGRRSRDHRAQVVVRLAADGTDVAGVVIGVAADIRALAGTLPTQILLADPHELQSLRGEHRSARILAE